MASLFRPTITRFYDSSGRQCSSSTPGAKRKKEKSKTWNGEYRGPDGKSVRESLGTTDREEAQDILNNRAKKARREAADDYSPTEEHRDRPLVDHLGEFAADLRSRDDTERHVDLTVARIKAAFDGCGFRMIRNISASALMQFLADKRKPYVVKIRGKDKQRRGIGPSTFNGYLIACKSFTAWLVKARRAKEDVLSHLSRINAKTDVRRERRAITDDEFQRIVTAAQASALVFRGLTGIDRAMLYRVAAFTGIRVSELASLTKASFNLNADVPTVVVEAGYSKRGSRDTLPLHPDLVSRLREWFETLAVSSGGESVVLSLADASEQKARRLWPGTWSEKGAKMLRYDLKAAGVAYQTEAGYADMHSMRHLFITRLANSGAHPKVMQELARHSTITLTLDRYSHAGLLDMNKALQGLPAMQGSGTPTATGTDG